MIIDVHTRFSGSHTAAGVISGQSLTDDAISEHVLDLRNFRTGVSTPATADEALLGFTDMWLIVQVLTSAAGGDAAKTMTTTLESDSAVGLDSSATVHYTTSAFTGATLVAGFTIARVQLPSGDYERYLGLRYAMSAAFTAFQVIAFLTPNPQRNIVYPREVSF